MRLIRILTCLTALLLYQSLAFSQKESKGDLEDFTDDYGEEKTDGDCADGSDSAGEFFVTFLIDNAVDIIHLWGGTPATEFGPYPHMTIGLRLKLLDLRDGQLLWALEQVWDSADKTTESHIKDYFLSQKRTGYAPLHEQLATVSSLEFIKFVSYEVAETL